MASKSVTLCSEKETTRDAITSALKIKSIGAMRRSVNCHGLYKKIWHYSKLAVKKKCHINTYYTSFLLYLLLDQPSY
jgi:hypothetical protein